MPVKVYAIVFGLFLGVCIWKFGNPVILDHAIIPPSTLPEFLTDPWPTHWANWFLLPLMVWGGVLAFRTGVLATKNTRPSKWLWLLPLVWLAWQFLAGTQSVDASLTSATLWQFGGCVACYLFGAFIFARAQLTRWVLVGVLAAFTFCLVRGVDQRLFEYPQSYRDLVQGEQTEWTNFAPAMVLEMKVSGLIVTTNNNLEVANPAVLAKFAHGRVCGTLVYPNALAQIILLLWPVSLALALGATRLQTVEELRTALTTGQLVVYYQPVVALAGTQASQLLAVRKGDIDIAMNLSAEQLDSLLEPGDGLLLAFIGNDVDRGRGSGI